ncbi:DUF1294 domain-containing protein [Diaphorobacter caeni]|uniref:DUF1294 domain-containing protein n=1 Tax=Diaphorobacter caeni TaxID=2784387 RepID=UPI0018900B56|nr:DUF1294 domain-containing protein [Diaphorobacter caeni]MBF5005833.1 DUF1294 domain-containing protein [Diaphorobacter caeni]
MRKQGTIRRWDDARGFGFIDSGDSRDVFVHVRDFARSGVSPVSGMQVTYEEIQVGGKGPRAMDVRAVNASTASAASAGRSSNAATSTARTAERRGDRPREAAYRTNAPGSARQTRPESRRPASATATATGSSLAMLLMLVWLALLAGGVWFQRLPFWVLGAMLVLNLVTFMVYALDKSAAQSGRWRTSEKQLHLMAVLGGWPAAWFAQQALRHKSSKQEFRTVYWLTLLVNVAALGALVFVPGLGGYLPEFAHMLR